MDKNRHGGVLSSADCALPVPRHVCYILAHGQETKARIISVKAVAGGIYHGKPVVYILKVKYKAGGEKRTGTLHPPGLSKEESPGFTAGTLVPIKFLSDKPNEITLTLPVTLNKMESVLAFANFIGPAW